MKENKSKKVATIPLIVGIILFVLLSSLYGPSIVEWLFEQGKTSPKVLSSSFKPEQILEYYGIILAFLGTTFLGVIALWQNHQFKKSNDEDQKQLNTNVDILARANAIIADENVKLIKLEEENQRIQLLLAQDYIPFLEFNKIILRNPGVSEKPASNIFTIQQNGDIRYVHDTNELNKKRKQIQYYVFIKEEEHLVGYSAFKFQLVLHNNSKARIDMVDFESLRIFSSEEKTHSFERRKLQENETLPTRFFSSETGVFDFEIVCDSDYCSYFPRNLEIKFRLVTTTGVSFSESIILKQIDNETNREVEYKIEGTQP